MRVINEIMDQEPLFCTSETRIAEIKHLLKKYDHKEILVLDSERDRHPIGVVSLEDMDSAAVEDRTQPSDTSAVECMNVMRNNHMEFIPVVDLNGHVRGIVEKEILVKLMM